MRGLESLSEADGMRHVPPMNSISWNVGHLAWQEQRYWLYLSQGKVLIASLDEQFAYGAPASTPPLCDALENWREITQA